MAPQLLKLAGNSGQLWCEGLSSHSSKPHKHAQSASIVIDSSGSDDDENRPTKACKKKRRYRLWMRKLRVQNLADKLQAKHGNTFNRIQYKLQAEALDVKKHDRMSVQKRPFQICRMGGGKLPDGHTETILNFQFC